MALIGTPNPDRPNGACPVGTVTGAPWNGNLRVAGADGAGSDIFRRDLINAEADGFVDQYDAGDVGVLGVFMGMTGEELRSVEISEQLGYYDASAGASEFLLVCLGVNLIVEMQEDGVVDPLELADRYANIEIIDGGGNTVSGLSGMELDSSTHATTSTLPLSLYRLVDRVDNQLGDVDATKPNARWLVTFNNLVLGNHAKTGL